MSTRRQFRRNARSWSMTRRPARQLRELVRRRERGSPRSARFPSFRNSPAGPPPPLAAGSPSRHPQRHAALRRSRSRARPRRARPCPRRVKPSGKMIRSSCGGGVVAAGRRRARRACNPRRRARRQHGERGALKTTHPAPGRGSSRGDARPRAHLVGAAARARGERRREPLVEQLDRNARPRRAAPRRSAPSPAPARPRSPRSVSGRPTTTCSASSSRTIAPSRSRPSSVAARSTTPSGRASSRSDRRRRRRCAPRRSRAPAPSQGARR